MLLILGTGGAVSACGGIPYEFGGMLGGGGEPCWEDACPCCNIARMFGGRLCTPTVLAEAAGGGADAEVGGGIGWEYGLTACGGAVLGYPPGMGGGAP